MPRRAEPAAATMATSEALAMSAMRAAPAALAAAGERLPFPVLLDRAVPWTLRHLRTLYPWAALPAVLIAGGVSLAQLLWPGPDPRADPLAATLHNLGYLLLYLPLYWLYSALRVGAVDALAGRPVSFWRAIRFVARPRVLGTEAMVFLCLIGSALCCFLPALYVGPLVGLTMVAMAAEGSTGLPALRRSVQLMRHNPEGRLLASPLLKVLALWGVSIVLSYLLVLLFELPFFLLRGASILRRMAAGEDLQRAMASWLLVPLRGLEALSGALVQLYASFVLALLFFDLRERREGTALRQAVAEIAGGDGGPQAPAERPDPAVAPPPFSPPSPQSPPPR